MCTTNISRAKALPHFCPLPRVGDAPPGLIQTLSSKRNGYQGWKPLSGGSLDWKTCRQMATTAQPPPTKVAMQKPPAFSLVLDPMRTPTKTTKFLSRSWSRRRRTKTPMRTQCKHRAWRRDRPDRLKHKPPRAKHNGGPETTGLGKS